MDKLKSWWSAHRPSTRRLVQLYTALLHNAHLKGFAEGEIYRGGVKGLCVPGLNCYSCPAAVGACPLGALQNAVAASASRPADPRWFSLKSCPIFCCRVPEPRRAERREVVCRSDIR